MKPELTPKRIAVMLGTAILITTGAVGAAYATPASGDDDAEERPIPAADLEQAEKAALEQTGGGRVTESEVDDEESKYEVEVTLDNGTAVDVQLDENLKVVSTESEDEAGQDSADDN